MAEKTIKLNSLNELKSLNLDFPSKKTIDLRKEKEEYKASLNKIQLYSFYKALDLLEKDRKEHDNKLRFNIYSKEWKIQQLYLKGLTPEKDSEELERAGDLILKIGKLATKCGATVKFLEPSERF